MISLSKLPEEDRALLSDIDSQFPIWGPVTEDLIGSKIIGFRELFEKMRGKKIFLNINSPGGCEGSLVGLYSLLKANDIEVATFASGEALSAGFFAFMLGEKTRYICSTSYLMIHEAQLSFKDESRSETFLEKKVVWARNATDVWFRMAMKRSKWSKGFKKFREEFSHDRYLTPEEALHYGFATAIIDPFS